MTGWDRFAARGDAIGFWLIVSIVLRVADVGWHGFTPDELGHLSPGGPWAQWLSAETTANPPLFRAMISIAEGPAGRAELGRIVAWTTSGLAAAVMAFGVPSRWAGARWLAPLPFVVLPVVVRATGEARAYALWSLVASVWLLAVASWWDSRDRRMGAVVVAAGVLLPWIHHLSTPWLVLCGLAAVAIDPARGRALCRLLLPAGLLALPLVWRVLGPVDVARPQAVGGIWTRLQDLVALTTGPWPVDGVVSMAVVGLVLGGASTWRETSAPVRWLGLTVLATWIVLPVVHTVHVVRPPAGTVMIVPFGLWLASWTGERQPGALRSAIGAAMLALVLASSSLQAQHAGARPGWMLPDGARWVAGSIEDAPSGDVDISPPVWAGVVWNLGSDRFVADAVGRGVCSEEERCVPMAGRAVRARDAGTRGDGRWWVHVGRDAIDAPHGCRIQPDTPRGVRLADCASR